MNHRLGERARPVKSTSTTPHPTIAKRGNAALAQEEDRATNLLPHSAMYGPKTAIGTSLGVPFGKQHRQHKTPPPSLPFTPAPSKNTASTPLAPLVRTPPAHCVLSVPLVTSFARLVLSAPPKALGPALASLPVCLSSLLV